MNARSKSPLFALVLAIALSGLSAQAAPLPPEILSVNGPKPTAGGAIVQISGNELGQTTGVTIAGVPAQVGTVTPNQVDVTIPEGQGVNLLLELQATNGNTQVNFSYDAPVISTLDYTALEGATPGGGQIEIQGTNFGTLNGSVTFDQASLALTSQDHNSITFTLPEGQGPGVEVSVTVSGQTSNISLFNYSPPSITEATPERALSSSVEEVTVTGVNFGTAYDVTYDGAPVTLNASSHTQFSFDKPVDAEGGDKEIVVTREAESSPGFIFRSVALTSLPGYYIDLENELVLPAPAGTFTDQEDMLVPTTVTKGSYTPIAGMRAPIAASRGYYVPDDGASSQIAANPGFVAPDTGMDELIPANPGSYAPIPGMQGAVSASPGHYVGATGQSTQSAADPGSFVASSGASSQSDALPGQYAPLSGMTGALSSPPGYYTDAAGSSSATAASVGHYVSSPGATTQTEADPGRFVPFSGMANQLSASKGYYVPASGASSQQAARAGHFTSVAAATTDTEAPAGTYAPIEGLHAAIPAPEGSYSPTPGATSLQPIPAGFTSNDNGATIEALPQLSVTAYTLESNGDNTISFETAEGQTYGIFYTENLIDFTRLLLVPGTGGIVSRTFTPPTTTSGKRFYVVGASEEP